MQKHEALKIIIKSLIATGYTLDQASEILAYFIINESELLRQISL
jgi:hypothetical protein